MCLGAKLLVTASLSAARKQQLIASCACPIPPHPRLPRSRPKLTSFCSFKTSMHLLWAFKTRSSQALPMVSASWPSLPWVRSTFILLLYISFNPGCHVHQPKVCQYVLFCLGVSAKACVCLIEGQVILLLYTCSLFSRVNR